MAERLNNQLLPRIHYSRKDKESNFYCIKLKREKSKVILLDPSAVADMPQCNDLAELLEMYGALHLDHAEMIICPINDNLNPLKASNFEQFTVIRCRNSLGLVGLLERCSILHRF